MKPTSIILLWLVIICLLCGGDVVLSLRLRMDISPSSPSPSNIRDKATSPFTQAAKLTSMLGIGSLLTRPLSASARGGSNSITVLGANGRTGTKAVQVAAIARQRVYAVTRSGQYTEENNANKEWIKNVASDVTQSSTYGSLEECLRESRGVIFAASASKNGGTPQQVDRDGVVEMAKLCIANKVPRFVVISSGAVTKPASPVYLFLNVFGGIMKAKIEGEDELRRLYNSDLAKTNGCTYTIIRPGGLTEEPPKGVSELELNQGDDRSGRISRWDVASLAVECIKYKDAENTTFECYDKNTAQPLANVGVNNILKKTEAAIEKTGFERSGDTFAAIFKGLTAII